MTKQCSALDSNSSVVKSMGSCPTHGVAAIVDEMCNRDRLSLAESHGQRVHACTFPLFVIKDGGH